MQLPQHTAEMGLYEAQLWVLIFSEWQLLATNAMMDVSTAVGDS